MECYQCLQSGINRNAVGLCHHCSAALCSDHIFAVEEPLMVKHGMVPPTVFPKRARLMLCSTCRIALGQFQDEPAMSTEVCR